MMRMSPMAARIMTQMLVHFGRGSILPAYVLIRCTFDDALVSRFDRKRLPRNWRSYPPPPELQLIGDEWVNRSPSAVLEVPSAVIETDSNYLLNPHHPDFKAVRVMDPQRFGFDLRLLKP